MDNLAHTLVGAALGQAGLKKKSGLGMATLMIAANLPDLDVVGLLFGENLAWRRGWTHGPLALVLLPPLLVAGMLTFDRWQARRGTRPHRRPPLRPGGLLLLAYIGILTHPLLDFLNTYGIRCLMPFSDRWFYGDALFIIDVWMWTVLAAGIWLSRRRERAKDDRPGRPAFMALLAITFYSGAMGLASLWAERLVAREVAATHSGQPQKVVASPVPIDPFQRRIVYQLDGRYGFGTVQWRPTPMLQLEADLVPTNMDNPAIPLAASQDKKMADFLYWSRLPFAVIEEDARGVTVAVGDARYDRRPEDSRFGAKVFLPRPETKRMDRVSPPLEQPSHQK